MRRRVRSRCRPREREGEGLGVRAGPQRLVGTDVLLEPDCDRVVADRSSGGEQGSEWCVRRDVGAPAERLGKAKVPLTSRPVAVALGSPTESVASPALEITVAVVV